MFDDNLERKNAFLDYKDKESNKWKSWDFSWLWSKHSKIFHLLLLRKIGQENVFDDILERKKLFQKRVEKLLFFSKGLVNGFGQFWYFFGKIGQKNVFIPWI